SPTSANLPRWGRLLIPGWRRRPYPRAWTWGFTPGGDYTVAQSGCAERRVPQDICTHDSVTELAGSGVLPRINRLPPGKACRCRGSARRAADRVDPITAPAPAAGRRRGTRLAVS